MKYFSFKYGVDFFHKIIQKIASKKPQIEDFIYINSKKINFLSFFLTFITIFFFTSFVNAVAIFAFHMFFAGVLSSSFYEKTGVEYLQFERYRDDIQYIIRKRDILFSISCALCGIFLTIFFSNINIIDFTMSL